MSFDEFSPAFVVSTISSFEHLQLVLVVKSELFLTWTSLDERSTMWLLVSVITEKLVKDMAKVAAEKHPIFADPELIVVGSMKEQTKESL